MPVIFSTLTTDIKFEEHAKAEGASVPKVVRSVFIRGGANRVNKHLEAPAAGMTEVTDEEYAWLLSGTHGSFQSRVDKGFLKVVARKVDPEVAASDMARGDRSAQRTPEDEDMQVTDNRGQMHVPSAGATA